MPQFRFTVNGRERTVDTPGDRPLLEVIREDLKLTGTKYGCGEGQCPRVHGDAGRKPAISCVTPVASIAGKKIMTIEGLAAGASLHRVQQAFLDEGAMQCGYCVPGMVLRTVALLEKTPKPVRNAGYGGIERQLVPLLPLFQNLGGIQKAAGIEITSTRREE